MTQAVTEALEASGRVLAEAMHTDGMIDCPECASGAKAAVLAFLKSLRDGDPFSTPRERLFLDTLITAMGER